MRIQEIIPLTIQGEGFYAGTPCSFVRLFGCNVGCYFCDTGYAKGGSLPAFELMSLPQILTKLESNTVVITGGEPTISPDLEDLINGISLSGRTISIETAGLKYIPAMKNTWVTFSPKDHVSDTFADPIFWKIANEIKIVIRGVHDVKYYESRIIEAQQLKIPIFFQPEWSALDSIRDILIEEASRLGVKVSLQSHKFLGVR